MNIGIYKKQVKEIDLNLIKPSRAGVILYTKIGNETYFGLGIDTGSKELTDFGGGISYKERDKDVILGALREFKEETLGIFPTKVEDVLESLVIYNGQNLTIFKSIVVEDVEELCYLRHLFLKTHQKQSHAEVSDIVWMTMNEFKHAIMTRGKMFFRLQNFLQKAGNFYWLL